MGREPPSPTIKVTTDADRGGRPGGPNTPWPSAPPPVRGGDRAARPSLDFFVEWQMEETTPDR